MNQTEFTAFMMELNNVQQEENFGYLFFFVGDDHRLPFATIGYADNDFDRVSDLNRDGAFRINIGVSKETYNAIIPNLKAEDIDYSEFNIFMPHPHYSKQNFVCILNPIDDNVTITKNLIIEAHAIAEKRTSIKSSK